MNERELRFVADVEIEFRAGTDDEPTSYVEGLGIVYGREVEIWPGYMEMVRKGAFTKSANGSETKSFFNHNSEKILSTTKADPKLEIEDTDAGLRFKSPIPPTTYGADLIVNLDRKNVRGASFSFSVTKDIVTIDENDVYHREIVTGELYELGPVTNPAYPQAKVGLRSVEEVANSIKERCAAAAPVAPVAPLAPESHAAPDTSEADKRSNEMLIRRRKLDLIER